MRLVNINSSLLAKKKGRDVSRSLNGQRRVSVAYEKQKRYDMIHAISHTCSETKAID